MCMTAFADILLSSQLARMEDRWISVSAARQEPIGSYAFFF